MINYKDMGLTDAEVVMVLFNNSQPLGVGLLASLMSGISSMTLEEAEKLVKKTKNFDYLYGKVMKITLNNGTFDEWLYDRDNGQGAAQSALNKYLANRTDGVGAGV